MNHSIFQTRTEACQFAMQAKGIDLLVLFPSPNLYYLTGFMEKPGERVLMLILPASGDPCMVVPQMYENHIGHDAWVSDLRSWKDGDDPVVLLKQAIDEKAPNSKKVLVDDQMWSLFFLPLQSVMPNATFDVASSLLGELRMRKDAAEIELLQSAGKMADQTFEWIITQPFEGQTETEIANLLAAKLTELGGEEIAFTIVASGPNGAMPHHNTGSRKIQRGDAIVMDFGCRVGGYYSDITRTVVCGEASDEVKKVYEIVKQAQAAGVAACKPGATCEDIDQVTRAVIDQTGYGKEFLHRTGHGLGLEVHEPPYIVSGDQTILEPGMTFSVEPGIYLHENFGIRIEDIVTITEDGVMSLNQCTHEMQIVN